MIEIIDTDLIVYTAEEDSDWHQHNSFNKLKSYGSPFPPVVVSPVYVDIQKHFIILDGNHRAYKYARYKHPINALIINKDEDRDEILILESNGVIPSFPYRDFLMGEKTLKTLKNEALEVAKKVNGTIRKVAEMTPKEQFIMKAIEKIIPVLRENDYNLREAAETTGMDYRALRRITDKYGLTRAVVMNKSSSSIPRQGKAFMAYHERKEIELIKLAIRKNNYNIEEAAKFLMIEPTELEYKVNKYGLLAVFPKREKDRFHLKRE